ncbi:glycoprotein precursor p2 [pistacia virus B]|uniref:Glycoprotein p2 n=1 Tax=pistacia virus B TaxID=2848035 RepID=A0A410JAL7_9VIRU|nr:glycoprotein precursor p2 [Pistacia emaravirus]QAR18003.1 glycoprotein precursor p2 [pistacia virus B]
MGCINMIVAILVIITSCTTVYTRLKSNGDVCDCFPEISRHNKEFLVCFHGCPIKPVNSRLYNVSCMHMEDITITLCEGNRYITSKPEIEIHDNYIWNMYILKTWKVAITIFIWLFMILMKIPSLCLLSMLNKIINKMLGSKLKDCDNCGAKYILAHMECPTPSFRHRTDYNFIFYIVLILTLITTAAKADDNIYNYYGHGNSTEIQVLDKEHFSQDFNVEKYLYTFTILNSHLELDVINISEILMPTKHKIDAIIYSCDGIQACKDLFFKHHGVVATWWINKVHDGLSCAFASATICGTCSNEYIKLGDKITTAKVRPYVDIEVKHGNKTEIIKIRDFSTFIHQPFYMKPLPQVLVESVEMFVTGTKVYRGQICNMPGPSCFGPNYRKNGKIYQLMTPTVMDPMSYDREIILENCASPGNSDVNTLEITNYVYQNNTLIMPFSFGMLSIGIPLTGKLIGDFCEKPVRVLSVTVEGCYDCQMGFEIKVKYDHVDRCGMIKCKVGRVIYENFVDSSSDEITLHSFYGEENVKIDCNGYLKEFSLDHPKDTNYYKTTNEIHGSAPSDFNLFKHLPNLFGNFKAMVVTLLISITLAYMMYNIIKQMLKHYFNMRADRKIRYHKRTDLGDIEMTNEFIVIEGPPQ